MKKDYTLVKLGPWFRPSGWRAWRARTHGDVSRRMNRQSGDLQLPGLLQ